MARVVVVGGGLGGLAVAARLARTRHEVTVLDRGATLGGSLRGWDVDGLEIPAPPASFTMPAVMRDLFRKTGRPIEDVLELAAAEPARRYLFEDGSILDLPNGNRAASIAAFDEALGGRAGAEWEALLVRGRDMWDVLRRDVVEQPTARPRDLVRALASRRKLETLQAGRSLHTVGRAALSDVRARLILDSYAAAVGADPRRAPGALALLPYLEHAFGLWHVVGGMPRLLDALADRAALRGAEFRTRAEVVEITVTDGRVHGLRLSSGERLDADVVVVAMDVRAAARLVSAGPAPWPTGRRGAGMSRFTAVLSSPTHPAGAALTATSRTHLSTDERASRRREYLEPWAAHPVETVLLGDTGAAPITVCQHQATGGSSYWTVSRAVPASSSTEPDWGASGTALSYAASLLDAAAARGLDLRAASIRRTESPADLEEKTGAPGGAVLGPPPHGLGGAFARAANASAVVGLYAVGASAHPGPGLPFVGMSAVLVSELIGAVPRAGGVAAP